MKENNQNIILDTYQIGNKTYALMPKPFGDWDDLMTRSRTVYCSADLLLDEGAGILYKNGEKVNVTRTEYCLIMHLMKNQSMICPRSTLLRIAEMRYHHILADNTLSKHINRARRKLGEHLGVSYIRTENSAGYHWRYDVSRCYVLRLEQNDERMKGAGKPCSCRLMPDGSLHFQYENGKSIKMMEADGGCNVDPSWNEQFEPVISLRDHDETGPQTRLPKDEYIKGNLHRDSDE